MFGKKLRSADAENKKLREENKRLEQENLNYKRDYSVTNQELRHLLVCSGDYLDHSPEWMWNNKRDYSEILSELGCLIKGYVIYLGQARFDEYLNFDQVKLETIPEKYRSQIRQLSLNNIFSLGDCLRSEMDQGVKLNQGIENSLKRIQTSRV